MGHREDVPADDPRRRLNEAVQEYVNAVDMPGVLVSEALVCFELVTFDPVSGEPLRRIGYVVPTDDFSLSTALGLARTAEMFIERDVHGLVVATVEE